jgi:ribosomal protein S18 acetylase RimI-like enzyme
VIVAGAELAARGGPEARPDELVLGEVAGGALRGVARVVPLPIDTEICGLAMARVELTASAPLAELGPALVVAARERGLAHLRSRVALAELWAMHTLEDAGFRARDVLATLVHDTPPAAPANPAIRPLAPGDAEPLAELARGRFRSSFFYLDPVIGEAAADRMFETWTRNLCAGQADAVFVADRGAGPVGFVALRACELTLIAVAPVAEGQGLGAALVDAALGYAAARKQPLEVRTQLDNPRALALYERGGFRFQQAALTLSRALG